MAQRFVANLIVFARLLHSAGLTVRTTGVGDAIEALTDIGIRRKSDVRDALRTVFMCRQADLARFDELFEHFWRAPADRTSVDVARPMRVPPRVTTHHHIIASATSNASTREKTTSSDEPVAAQIYSADEAWRRKDFAAFTADDISRAKQEIGKLTWNPGVRVTRRWVEGGNRVVDLRRVLRANAKHGGELVVLPHRVRRLAPRPLILICDISGSMEPYTRLLLVFAHAMARAERRVEVFVFSTRLTRITRQFNATPINDAVANVRDAVRDWSGGTRIGDAIKRFNTDWARRVLHHQPVVLLISDGWDLGDPEVLRREIARLQRSSFRLIWLNPLLGSPGYEPLTRGMRAALPFVDDFLSVHNLASLESLASHLNGLSERRANRRAATWN
jgi:uncharacterized protein with von Willebrand factor type A (vWA) domain